MSMPSTAVSGNVSNARRSRLTFSIFDKCSAYVSCALNCMNLMLDDWDNSVMLRMFGKNLIFGKQNKYEIKFVAGIPVAIDPATSLRAGRPSWPTVVCRVATGVQNNNVIDHLPEPGLVASEKKRAFIFRTQQQTRVVRHDMTDYIFEK